jgi:UDP-N-acetylmuramate dehydrogenase
VVSDLEAGERSAELDRLAGQLGELVRREVPIGPLTTYRVGGAARLYAEPNSSDELDRLVSALAASPVKVPVLVIGKGSNLLVADRGWDGLCVHLGEGFSSIELDGLDVVAGGATAYPVLARRTAAAGLTGMEWAVGIPGSVGGAVRMNAGGHGAETSERLVCCRIADLAAGTSLWVSVDELGLSYRHSAITATDLVVSARFRLEQGDVNESAVRIAEIVRWRRQNQPGGQNAGSVFTNPPGDSAGRLIDAAGLKDYRLGSAAVSEKHANFIQADPSGSADDVRRLVEAVQGAVAERLGVHLDVELQMVGWDPSSGDPSSGDPSSRRDPSSGRADPSCS